MGGYAGLAVLKPWPPFSHVPDIPGVLDAAAIFAMGMLLVFRTNRAYERWWEARIQWGKLVNVSRNLAVKLRAFAPLDESERQHAASLIVAFSESLMDHLREDIELETLEPFLEGEHPPNHPPSFVSRRIYELLDRWREQGKVSEQTIWMLDREARGLLDVCGACERIKYTLMAQSWRLFTRQCICVYLLVLPWGLYDDFLLWTIPLTVVISYFVIGSEGIAHYIEEPFGHHEDHLDLPELCRTIDKSVSGILG
jgi:putative membrane protein